MAKWTILSSYFRTLGRHLRDKPLDIRTQGPGSRQSPANAEGEVTSVSQPPPFGLDTPCHSGLDTFLSQISKCPNRQSVVPTTRGSKPLHNVRIMQQKHEPYEQLHSGLTAKESYVSRLDDRPAFLPPATSRENPSSPQKILIRPRTCSLLSPVYHALHRPRSRPQHSPRACPCWTPRGRPPGRARDRVPALVNARTPDIQDCFRKVRPASSPLPSLPPPRHILT